MPFRKFGEPFRDVGKPLGIPGGGGAAAFLPTDISGLLVWFDFSDISTLFQDSLKTTPVTADGDEIGAAEDKSGNGRDALQPTATKLPLFKTAIQNGLSIARFDGTNDFLVTSSYAVLQPSTRIVIVKINTAADHVINSVTGNKSLNTNGGNVIVIFAGVTVTGPANDAAFHSIVGF